MSGIDDWLPVFDESSRHSIFIDASCDTVWDALFTADFSRHPAVRALLALRSVPSLLLSPRRTLARFQASRAAEPRGVASFLSSEFAMLAEDPPHGLVLGLTGRFWTPSGGLTPTDPSTFRDQVPEGLARAAWSFHLAEYGDGTTLTTETRVLCGGDAARRAFRAYWRLIRPFSGLIRVAILGRVKRRAEAGAGRAGLAEPLDRQPVRSEGTDPPSGN